MRIFLTSRLLYVFFTINGVFYIFKTKLERLVSWAL